MSSIREFEYNAKEILQSLGYDKGESDAICRRLIEDILKISNSKLFLLDKDTQFSIDEEMKAVDYLDKLKKNEPLQYILSKADFYKYQIIVDKSVLIPRPETEELCLLAIDEIKRLQKIGKTPIRIWDICTGSSVIAYTLAMELVAKDYILASDLSKYALETAKKNIANIGEGKAKIELLEDDILQEKSKNCGEKFDIIISNPPYIMPSEAIDMEDNVLKNEPYMALFAPENDPIIFYKAIASLIKLEYLRKDGIMLFEINPMLAKETKKAISEFSGINLEYINIIKDIYGKERFIRLRNNRN